MIEIGDRVFIKSEKLEGTVHILEGIPTRKAWVEVSTGAQANFRYMKMYDIIEEVTQTLTLNVYDIEDLRKI